MEPTGGEMAHETAVFEAPLTVALNCWGADEVVRLAVKGDTETLTTGFSVTTAVAVFALSATLVAVTVTVCPDASVAGGTYKPLAEIEPTWGEMDQVAAVLAGPVTVAENCWDNPGLNVAVAGESEMDVATGTVQVPSATIAFASAVKPVLPTSIVCGPANEGKKMSGKVKVRLLPDAVTETPWVDTVQTLLERGTLEGREATIQPAELLSCIVPAAKLYLTEQLFPELLMNAICRVWKLEMFVGSE